MKIKYYIIFILLITIIGCREEFNPGSSNYLPIMVVDGAITNQTGPYTVKISLTAPIDFREETPYKNCSVILMDNKGNSEVLNENEPGVYQTTNNGIKGIVGNEYSLSIVTPDGKEYNSEFQRIPEPVEIDAFYAEFEYKEDLNYVDGLPGYQFYVNTKEANQNENYILWNMIETYEYNADYELYAVETRFGDYIYKNPRFDTLQTCWKTDKVNYIFTGNTADLSVPIIKKRPLHFISTETKKLAKRYSVLVKQYCINKESYEYWKNIEDQISNTNFLTTTQPQNILSNVKNVNDKDEVVLGYFTTASVTEQRIFINKPLSVPFYYSLCSAVLSDPFAIEEYRSKRPPPAPPFYWVLVNEDMALIENSFVSDCIDCRSEGGELKKPDFWVDE